MWQGGLSELCYHLQLIIFPLDVSSRGAFIYEGTGWGTSREGNRQGNRRVMDPWPAIGLPNRALELHVLRSTC